MMQGYAFGFLVPFMLLFGLGWIITTWIRAKYGYPLDDGAGGQVRKSGPSSGEVAEHVAKALADRDATIARLEERVRVLERIVTDEPARLSREIESLRA